VQTEIKANVSPVPYTEVARNSYADSWRQTGVGANA
jgi:syringate O-demethylase